MLSNSIVCYREIVCKRKSQSVQQTSLLSYFNKLPQPPQPSVTTTLRVSSHQHQHKTLHQQKIMTHKRPRRCLAFFSNKVFLIKVCTLIFRHDAIAHFTGYNTV